MSAQLKEGWWDGGVDPGMGTCPKCEIELPNNHRFAEHRGGWSCIPCATIQTPVPARPLVPWPNLKAGFEMYERKVKKLWMCSVCAKMTQPLCAIDGAGMFHCQSCATEEPKTPVAHTAPLYTPPVFSVPLPQPKLMKGWRLSGVNNTGGCAPCVNCGNAKPLGKEWAVRFGCGGEKARDWCIPCASVKEGPGQQLLAASIEAGRRVHLQVRTPVQPKCLYATPQLIDVKPEPVHRRDLEVTSGGFSCLTEQMPDHVAQASAQVIKRARAHLSTQAEWPTCKVSGEAVSIKADLGSCDTATLKGMWAQLHCKACGDA